MGRAGGSAAQVVVAADQRVAQHRDHLQGHAGADRDGLDGVLGHGDGNAGRLAQQFVPLTQTGLAGNFEVGYVFYRQLFYVDGPPQIVDLPQTIMFRLGLAY